MNEIQGDELLSLMQVTRYRFISGSRPRHDRLPLLSKAQLLPALIPASCKVRLFLEDGQWKKVRAVKRAAADFRIDFDCVLNFLPVCESDRGRYIALPTDSTPTKAPDEV